MTLETKIAQYIEQEYIRDHKRKPSQYYLPPNELQKYFSIYQYVCYWTNLPPEAAHLI